MGSMFPVGESTDTMDYNGRLIVDVTTGGSNGKTWDNSLKSFHNGSYWLGIKCLGHIDRRHGNREVSILPRAITNDNDNDVAQHHFLEDDLHAVFGFIVRVV